jgi:hypothetical protein
VHDFNKLRRVTADCTTVMESAKVMLNKHQSTLDAAELCVAIEELEFELKVADCKLRNNDKQQMDVKAPTAPTSQQEPLLQRKMERQQLLQKKPANPISEVCQTPEEKNLHLRSQCRASRKLATPMCQGADGELRLQQRGDKMQGISSAHPDSQQNWWLHKQAVAKFTALEQLAASKTSPDALGVTKAAQLSFEDINTKKQIAELQPIPNFQEEPQNLQPISSSKVAIQEVNQNAELTVYSDHLQPQLCREQTNAQDCQAQPPQACCPEKEVKVSCQPVHRPRKKASSSCSGLTCKQRTSKNAKEHQVKPLQCNKEEKANRTSKIAGQFKSKAMLVAKQSRKTRSQKRKTAKVAKQKHKQFPGQVQGGQKGQSRSNATCRRAKPKSKNRARKMSSSASSLQPPGQYLKWMKQTDFYLQLKTALRRYNHKKPAST